MEQRRNRKRGPHNWLKSLDEAAANLPVAKSWLHPYGYFELTRYPRLQPHEPERGDLLGGYVRPGRQTYERQLREQEERISSNPGAHRALRKLCPEQRREVSALVNDLTVELEQHVRWKRMPEQMVRGTAPMKRLFRSMESKIRKLGTAAEEALRVARRLERLVGPDIQGDLRRISTQVTSLGTTLRTIHPCTQANAVRNSDYFQMAANDTPSFAMVQLFWLFHYGCALTVGDSEVRVAAIRNALWSKYATRVECAIRKSDESEGCDAVRRAVERFSPLKRTTP